MLQDGDHATPCRKANLTVRVPLRGCLAAPYRGGEHPDEKRKSCAGTCADHYASHGPLRALQEWINARVVHVADLMASPMYFSVPTLNFAMLPCAMAFDQYGVPELVRAVAALGRDR